MFHTKKDHKKDCVKKQNLSPSLFSKNILFNKKKRANRRRPKNVFVNPIGDKTIRIQSSKELSTLSQKEKYSFIQKNLLLAENQFKELCEHSKVSTYNVSIFCDRIVKKKLNFETKMRETKARFEKDFQFSKDLQTSVLQKYMEKISLVYDWKRLSMLIDLIQELRNHIRRSSNRKKYNAEQLEILNNWWDSNILNPYPKKQDIKILSVRTNLSFSQVRNFFQNKRSRERKQSGPSTLQRHRKR